MEHNHTYINFPLHFLAPAIKEPEYFNKILSYCIVKFMNGQPNLIGEDEFSDEIPLVRLVYTYFRDRQQLSEKAYEVLSDILIKTKIDEEDLFNKDGQFEFERLSELSEELKINQDVHHVLEQAMYPLTKSYAERKFGFSFGDMSIHEKNYQELKHENEAFNKIYGTDAYISIKPELLLKVAWGKFPVAEFNFLCAIKTIIGKRNYNKTYRNAIVQRACGAVREEVFNSYCIDSVEEFYHKYSKRYHSDAVLDSLARKELMCKLSPERRGYYVSTSLSLEELSISILKNKKKYKAKKVKETQYNEILSKELKKVG